MMTSINYGRKSIGTNPIDIVDAYLYEALHTNVDFLYVDEVKYIYSVNLISYILIYCICNI